MPKPIKFAHVVYRTRRFKEMIEWYEKVFQAKVQYKNPLLAFLTYDEEHHRFAFINLDEVNPEEITPASGNSDGQPVTGVDHVAYTYASLGDLLDTYSELKEQGIIPYWPVHHGVTVSFYYRDPDGNRLEFQVDCFANAEKGNAYMRSDAYASNPIGVAFDPEDFIEQLQNGTPEAQLLGRPDGPMVPIPSEHYLET